MSFGERKKRTLTADETALWAHVTNHIQPLSKRTLAEPDQSATQPPMATSPKSTDKPKIAAPYVAQKNEIVQRNKNELPPLAPLERRLRQRLSRGAHPIDAMIDLHGMRQTEAHDALRRFIYSAQRQGAS
ncbi:MAG: DNA mismatch repair protein MutS, partial [Verrucomicrobia bacterium]|nr:DNA mismatch repair protein MutS [Verrucomicrobiota bacterium]